LEIEEVWMILKGKCAIITGGGTGIGNGIAHVLAAQGVNLILCGRRAEPLEKTAAECRELSWQNGSEIEVLTLQADVSVEDDVKRVVQAAMDRFQTIDITINNAAIGGGRAIHEHPVEEWDAIIAVNLRGPFLLARAVLPHMRRQRSGHLINISSESGLEHYQGDGAYGVSKHALNALGEYIQRENQDYNIRVDTICPGMVVSEMTEGSPGLDQAKCLYPEDIAELVVWLLTRRANIKIGAPVLIQTMENPWS
jgi:NAD(P)-dependent dehydrogenase (short-subunit alcohol dehydrogenase family)